METRQDLINAMTSGIPTNPFAVAYLQLCQVSYLLPTSQIPAAVQALPPIVTNGFWRCVWGPATDPAQGNLTYVAAYYDQPTGLPVFAAVVVRGTDVYVNDWGIVEQIWEDLDVTGQSPMPWDPSNPARLANGTIDGLNKIAAMTSNGVGLIDFLASFLSNPANQKPVLVVTGHSLGGCLASVVAPWTKSLLASRGVNAPIVPCTFAGPTAGDARFASYFASTFRYSLRYYNSLDVVPRAWADLKGIETIYDAYGLTIPDAAWAAILGFRAAMDIAGVSYVQPTPNSPLNGVFALNLDWYGELGLQHHTTTYMSLLGGTSIPNLSLPAAPARRSVSRQLSTRLGSTESITARLKS